MPRKDFTDSQKAEIFARDRATCCFSGANLWLLDAPLRPGYQRDWVDHIVPSARGGPSEISNGVCASHTLNAKKRHNSADTAYLFRSGSPTRLHYELFGVPSASVSGRLERLSRLQSADWYFNRAIGLVLLAFDYRVDVEFYDTAPPSRDDAYWFRAAIRKMVEFQRFDTSPIEERLLIDGSTSSVQKVWLRLRTVRTEKELSDTVAPLYDDYLKSAELWLDYFVDSGSLADKKAVIRKLARASCVPSDVRECIQDDHSRRK